MDQVEVRAHHAADNALLASIVQLEVLLGMTQIVSAMQDTMVVLVKASQHVRVSALLGTTVLLEAQAQQPLLVVVPITTVLLVLVVRRLCQADTTVLVVLP